MQTEILYQPSYALCRITLAPGETVRAESGAMVSMDGSVQVETRATGGVFKSLGRSLLGGESFFQNTFSTERGGELTVAPSLPGDIMTLELAGHELVVQSGSYLASEPNVQVESRWGGGRSFFGGEGLFMLRCTGSGTLIISSYGSIHRVDVPAGERYVVDTGHIVAFPASMPYQVQKVGSWKSSLLGGEGFVCAFQGPGEVYLQTRSPESFLSWLIPQLPNRSSN